jgi:RimJ/RimL family protein N-acetyltransferase
MNFRHATNEDIQFATEHSISRGTKEFPGQIDYTYCLEHEGRVLAVGGVKLLLPTTAWAWMTWTEYAKGHKIEVYRVTKEWLDKLIQELKLTRVMAAVDPAFPEAVATVEHLGFTQESVMQKFFGDWPGFMFVRLAEK